jgi:hypothetical protein
MRLFVIFSTPGQHNSTHGLLIEEHVTCQPPPSPTLASMVKPGQLWKGWFAMLRGPYAYTLVGANVAGQPARTLGVGGSTLCAT